MDGTVWLEPGTYDLGETITMPSNVTISAAPGTVTLRALPGVQTMIGIAGSLNNGTADPARYVSICNLTIDGNSLNVGNTSPLIVSWIAQQISFVGDTIENARGIGALISNTASCFFVGDTFTNVGNYARITGNLSDAWQGIAFTDSSTFNSTGNRVIGSSFGQIGLDAVSATQQTNFVVAQSTFSDLNTLQGWQRQPQGAAGVYLDHVSGALILGDSISGASGNGVDIANSSTVSVAQSTIIGNYESGICAAGIDTLSVTDTTSDNNNVLNGHYPHTAGLTLTGGDSGSVTNVTLRKDNFENTGTHATQYYGLQVDAGTTITDLTATNVSLTGNTVASSNYTLTGQITPSAETTSATTAVGGFVSMLANSAAAVVSAEASRQTEESGGAQPTPIASAAEAVGSSHVSSAAGEGPGSTLISTDSLGLTAPRFAAITSEVSASPTTIANPAISTSLAAPLTAVGLSYPHEHIAQPLTPSSHTAPEAADQVQAFGRAGILSPQPWGSASLSFGWLPHGAASGAAASGV